MKTKSLPSYTFRKAEDSTPRTRDTDAHFFSCCLHAKHHQRTCIGSRPHGQGHVECLSPRAHPKSLIRLMFSGKFVELQISLPNPFRSFCSTPPLSQTSKLNARMSMNPCVTPQGGLLFARMDE